VSFEKAQWVWHNGSIVPWANAAVHVSAPSVQYGAGIFEGIRCYEAARGPAVFRLKAHLDRFYASAAHYEIQIPYSPTELEDAVRETVQSNGFTSCYIRPICYYGDGRPGLLAEECSMNVAILAWPWGPLFGAGTQATGVRVTVSKWTKFHYDMLPTTAKACGGYLNSMLAAREARHRGYDEALLLDVHGNVAEGPTENVFMVSQSRLITNDEGSSILLGITRDSVIQIARDLGYDVEIRTMPLDELRSASEAFFTGTAAEVAPIREVDGSLIGSGGLGPMTAKIQQAFFSAVLGRDKRYFSWLDSVAAPATRQGS
jgi:branched-chain amino acid aminotransferase